MGTIRSTISRLLPLRVARFVAAAVSASIPGRSSTAVTPTDLHVITVTDTSFTLAWMNYAHSHAPYFAPPPLAEADSEVFIAAEEEPLRRVHYDPTPRIYHQVTVEGLKPGTVYRFEARSGGELVTPNLFTTAVRDPVTSQQQLRTLSKPEGEFVQTVAVLNDTHVRTGARGPRSRQILRDQLAEIAQVRPSVVVVVGDVTNAGQAEEAAAAREILDSYGQLGRDYFVVRGNHDRPRTLVEDTQAAEGNPSIVSAEYCTRPGTYYDPFGDAFDLPFQRLWHTRVEGLRIIGLDSAETGNSGGGAIMESQLQEYEKLLADDPLTPTITLTHHPLTDPQALSAIGSRPFLIERSGAVRIEQAQAAAPGAFLHLSGHTHRPRRSGSWYANNVEFLETAASGEFPCGYTLIDLYTGGYMVHYHRPATSAIGGFMPSERWSARGFQPEYTLYRTDHRNFIIKKDLSALKRA